jgi:hypothetical protein
VSVRDGLRDPHHVAWSHAPGPVADRGVVECCLLGEFLDRQAGEADRQDEAVAEGVGWPAAWLRFVWGVGVCVAECARAGKPAGKFLAEVLDLDEGSVSLRLQGRRAFKAEELAAIREALNIDAEKLLGDPERAA